MDYPSVLLERKNGVATITLNRSENMNALSAELVSGFQTVLDRVQMDSDIRCVIITGSGKAFSVGGYIHDFPQGNAVEGRRFMIQAHRLLLELVSLERPVIAAVNGYAVGAGFNLALACDFIIASEKASFAQVFNKVGVVPDFGGLFFLPRIVGLPKAKELMFFGRTITAQEAKEYGVVLEVVPEETLMSRAEELAATLAEGPIVSVGMTKSIVNRSYEMTLQQVLHEEAMAQGIAFTTQDHLEGVRAFFEKRPPHFKGK